MNPSNACDDDFSTIVHLSTVHCRLLCRFLTAIHLVLYTIIYIYIYCGRRCRVMVGEVKGATFVRLLELLVESVLLYEAKT